MTPVFPRSRDIKYFTVANQFNVAVPTVCRIVHEKTKAIADNLTPSECVKFFESDIWTPLRLSKASIFPVALEPLTKATF